MYHRLHLKLIISFILFIGLLSSCGAKSEEEIIDEVDQIVGEAFNSKEMIEPTVDFESLSLSLYIPERFNLQREDGSNIFLNDGEQRYIIFYNKYEELTSTLNYEDAIDNHALLLKSFTDESKFGYVRIMSEEENYELQIGIGNIKVTTITDDKNIIQDTEDLMHIVLSSIH